MDHPSAPCEPAWIAADWKPLPPRALSRHGCRSSDAALLGHGASPPLVPPHTGGRGSLSMLGRQHAAGRYEVLVPTGTHPAAPVLPSHLHCDSDPISAHAREPEILITPIQSEVVFSEFVRVSVLDVKGDFHERLKVCGLFAETCAQGVERCQRRPERDISDLLQHTREST